MSVYHFLGTLIGGAIGGLYMFKAYETSSLLYAAMGALLCLSGVVIGMLAHEAVCDLQRVRPRHYYRYRRDRNRR